MTCTVPASPARLTPSMHSDVGLEDYFAQANATDTGVQSHVFSVVFCSMPLYSHPRCLQWHIGNQHENAQGAMPRGC